jgi:putative ABC transport system substrate-binding protein
VNRRAFIALTGGAAAWPRTTRAQQPERMRRIAVLSSLAAGDPEGPSFVAALVEALAGLGWIAGRDVQVDQRFAGGRAQLLRDHARELVGMSPDLIVAGSPAVVLALLQQTRTIPIVFASATDPVGQGFVESLGRPGGNVTGFTSFEFSMGGKWIELLKDIAPGLEQVAVVFNPDTAPYMESFLRFVVAAARSLSVQVSPLPIHSTDEIEGAITTIASVPGNGVIFPADAFTIAHYIRIIDLTGKHRLPAIYPFRTFAANGGLMSYGIDVTENYRQVAVYIDRIFKGAKPADLPVQQPTVFKLVINLKAAKGLGLDVPPMLLAVADEVIE